MGKTYCASRFKGVESQDGGKTWRSRVQAGKDVKLGSFETEELAARAHDKAWYLQTGDASGPNLGPLTAEELAALAGVTLAQFAASAKAARQKFGGGSSAFRGVCWDKLSSKWRVMIRNAATGKRENLGLFTDEVEAARAYDKRAFELRGAKAELNFPAEYGLGPAAPAAAGAAAAAAAAPEDDSEPDESEASPERIQRWISKGLLVLDPLPVDDGSFVYVNDDAADDGDGGDDGDGSDDDGSDGGSGTGSGFSSGDEEMYFDEQYPGEAEAADGLDQLFSTYPTPSELALAMQRDAALALHPALEELLALFQAGEYRGKEPSLAVIEIYREDAKAAACRKAAKPADDWSDALGPKSEPVFRGLPEFKGERQVCFQPEKNPEYPDWETCPFFDLGHGFVRLRNLMMVNGNLFEQAYELLEKRIAIERDWLDGTYNERAPPVNAMERREHAAPATAASRYFRLCEISHLTKQMLAIKDYEGIEVNNPGFLDELRARAAAVEAEMWQAHAEMELEQREQAEAAAPAEAPPPPPPPVPTFESWRDVPVPPFRAYDPDNAPLASIQQVGCLSADALSAMLQEDHPPQAVITLHADGRQTWDGPLADEVRARIDIVAAGLIAEGDARSAAITGSLEEREAQLWAQLGELSAKVDASEARCDEYRRRIESARADEYVMMQQSREEFSGPDLWPKFMELRAQSQARLAAEAEARAAAEAAAAPAAEAAAAEAAHAAHAAARTAQFEDAEEDAPPPPAPLRPGDVGDAFFNEADDEEIVAEMERQASAKLGRMDLPATIARMRARIAGADPLVQSCLGAVFTGFGERGTEEEGAVHTVLNFAARQLAADVAEREAAEEAE